MVDYIVRPVRDEDKGWISDRLTKHWGSPIIITRGKIHQGDELQGFIAEENSEKIGLITFNIEHNKCEIISLDSIKESIGVGSILIEYVKTKASSSGCEKLWLVTTNDNHIAISFYQKRGFNLAAVYPEAMEKARKLKPEIPLIGHNGIKIKDEIILEMKI